MTELPTALTPALCRDCQTRVDPRNSRCSNCGSKSLLKHPELFDLTIAHLDCDAFFASIEKRDQPNLAAKPVIIGGGKRGVVATCCYIARINGVRSAMPMFQALKLCPDAVVIKPDMKKYSEAGHHIRDMMRALTPDVQPLSIDEAFLDLKGTEKLHHASPAETLLDLSHRIEEEVGITVSIGLSHNKFLAKIASDLKKPHGFSVIGKAETLDFLATKPISIIWGIGQKTTNKLAKSGLKAISQLQKMDQAELIRAHGNLGNRLYYLSRGIDKRDVSPETVRKSLSKETTFEHDIHDLDTLDSYIWRLSQEVSDSLKRNHIAGRTITLKLKTHRHKTITRQTHLSSPTHMMHVIYDAATLLLKKVHQGYSYRLIGVGVADLETADDFSTNDIADPRLNKKSAAERAMDSLTLKFGDKAVIKGRNLS